MTYLILKKNEAHTSVLWHFSFHVVFKAPVFAFFGSFWARALPLKFPITIGVFAHKIFGLVWSIGPVLYTPPPVRSESDRIPSSLSSVRSESELSPSSVRSESDQNPSSVRAQSDQSPIRIRAQSELSPIRVRSESELSPSSVRSESELSPSSVQSESDQNPSSVWAQSQWMQLQNN